MSCTEIFGFDKEGNAYHQADVKNAWRGAVAIWRILEATYLPPYIPQYARQLGITTSGECKRRFAYTPLRCNTFEKGAIEEVWNLSDRQDVTLTDRICLYTTFDKCLVKREDIPKVIEAFRAFAEGTSLKEQADVLEQMYSDENCIAVGWNQTSVAVESWANFGGYDKDNDTPIPYNCLTGTEHYWLFDELMQGEHDDM